MASRPDRITVDSSADATLKFNGNSGWFSRFTNTFQPGLGIVGVKGVQLSKASFINPVMQLNDNAHLMFFFYRSNTAATIVQAANLRCVRLQPTWFQPATSAYTAYTRNRYFNTCQELVAALNAAASTGGDDVTYNPIWQVNDVTFSYDTATRKVSVTGNGAGIFYCCAAADDPLVQAYLQTNAIRLNTPSSAQVQPYTLGQSMNARIGYAMSYTNRSRVVAAATLAGAANVTNYPFTNAIPIEADAYPILFGMQSLYLYCLQAGFSGNDSRLRRNMLASIPITQPALAVCSYDAAPTRTVSLQPMKDIYQLDFEFRDEFGNPVLMPPNYNISLELSLTY
jgi:hypothetical protein